MFIKTYIENLLHHPSMILFQRLFISLKTKRSQILIRCAIFSITDNAINEEHGELKCTVGNKHLLD